MRILIIKTTSLGDVVHNLPVVADIKKQHPNALIDWVVEENFSEIPAMHPDVHNVIKVAIRRWRKSLFTKKTWQELRCFQEQLASQKYDFVIDTQGLLKSGLLTYLSNSQNKCGYDKNSARESIASWFYDHKYPISYQQHAVTRNRTLAALSLGYTPPKTPPNYGIQASPKAIPNLNQPYIVALHGTSRDSKLWLTEHWVNLGIQLEKQVITLALPWASEAEHQRAQFIANALQHAIILPKLNISALAEVISGSLAAIGVDTGLSHLAAALNKHVVAIYTDTNPALTGVMAGAKTCINLGGKNIQPSPQEVMTQLKAFDIVSHE
ncbi:MAG: lipopolysaccharide heptosyltransferase I [Methylotenera sp.]|uniref:lipopolysaccharide heptosyltransferase I n=1 Tax=Methylotenera sp. TaxID=2051956 RepID=UPI0027195FC4|nr:lipopolysaccharide heptosyltransferase I [Methylotenera sp.]MDO9392611.1 lipopolysaccharide heptosyltransferase I [Methylotenera sp.]MDP1522156.1 lipopolysaccharide heptosyltransferase I [Methylotenera sp.]